MTKQRRIEIILDHLKCLMKYFTLEDTIDEYIQNEICKGCPDYIHCKNTWQPWLEEEIKGILDSEFKLKVGASVLILTGGLKGQRGKITQIGAKHNNNGYYCFVNFGDSNEIKLIYPEDIEILK